MARARRETQQTPLVQSWREKQTSTPPGRAEARQPACLPTRFISCRPTLAGAITLGIPPPSERAGDPISGACRGLSPGSHRMRHAHPAPAGAAHTPTQQALHPSHGKPSAGPPTLRGPSEWWTEEGVGANVCSSTLQGDCCTLTRCVSVYMSTRVCAHTHTEFCANPGDAPVQRPPE